MHYLNSMSVMLSILNLCGHIVFSYFAPIFADSDFVSVQISIEVTQESYNSVRHTLQSGSSYITIGSPSTLVKLVSVSLAYSLVCVSSIHLLVTSECQSYFLTSECQSY